jgi:hypothetical protein
MEWLVAMYLLSEGYPLNLLVTGIEVDAIVRERPTGCSKRLSSKAAASEDRRRTLWGTLRI